MRVYNVYIDGRGSGASCGVERVGASERASAESCVSATGNLCVWRWESPGFEGPSFGGKTGKRVSWLSESIRREGGDDYMQNDRQSVSKDSCVVSEGRNAYV